MNVADAPGWLTFTDLTEPVRRRLGARGATVADWTCRSLTGGSSHAEGVWRIDGTALSGEVSRPWSLILKGWQAPAPDQPESSMDWPLREAELYGSGLLDDLPGGIVAPSCCGHLRRPDGTTWIWLEEVRDGTGGAWPLQRYASHARQLGRFNGAWATGGPLPELPCLSRGWIRERIAKAGPFVEQLPRLADQPIVRQVYPPAVSAAWQRMWDDRERWFAVLDRLPKAFCHMDAFPRNAFVRPGSNGRDQTVLIDWAFAGIGGLGEELTSPIVASVMFMEVPIDDARQLEAIAIEGYIDGLRDAGWSGNPDEVRHGYEVAAALRYGVGGMGRWLPVLLDERSHPGVERILGHPFEEAAAVSAAVQRWLVDLIPYD